MTLAGLLAEPSDTDVEWPLGPPEVGDWVVTDTANLPGHTGEVRRAPKIAEISL